jgi:tetratricopeptide (TPR) repeat protein
LTAAEPEDAVTAALFGLTADDPHVVALDEGCSAALEDYRLSLLDRTGTDFQVGLSRLTKLMRIILRVKPPGTVTAFHRDYIKWNAFFENFVVDRGLDLRREYWRILAQTQDDVPHEARDPRRLMPLWLSVCREAGNGGLYDISYLRIALMGLRGLPLGDLSSNVKFALQGLARWAAYREPSTHDFMREWRTLEEEYAFGPAFWPTPVEDVISSLEEEIQEKAQEAGTKAETFLAAAWWREDLGMATREVGPKRPRARELPAKERHLAIIKRLSEPFQAISSTIDRLIDDHRQYADTSGDVYYLIRTACNIGMRLREKGKADEKRTRGEMATRLARIAFEYDPVNVFAWSLLRDALVDAGRPSDAEQIGWEAIRRFPEDAQWKTQLAKVLVFPLARSEEAETLLRAAIEQDPSNSHGYGQLATVLADHLDRRGEAVDMLEKLLESTPDNVVARDLLRKAQEGRRLGKEFPTVADVVPPARVDLPTGQAYRALFRFERGLGDLASIQALLRQDDRDAYLTYVGNRSGARPARYQTTFALAFDAAARAGSAEALRVLLRKTNSIERFLTEGALNLLEGGVLPPLEGFPAWKASRLPMVDKALRVANVNMQQTLLRDVAASYLSTDVRRLLAA